MRTYFQQLRDNGCKVRTGTTMVSTLSAVGEKTREYNQGKRDPLGWRWDCSGWASYVMGAYLDGPGSWGGFSTETLATYGVIYPLPMSLAGPADFLGKCGPGTAGGGGGHIAPILDRSGNTVTVKDHGGSGPGPTVRKVQAGATGWASTAWRYVFRSDTLVPPTLLDVAAGHLSYTTDSFGGVVRDIQQLVNGTKVQAPIAVDGVFGPVTMGAVKAYQKASGFKDVDGIVGPQTAAKMVADWAILSNGISYGADVPATPPPSPPPPAGTPEIDYVKLAAAVDMPVLREAILNRALPELRKEALRFVREDSAALVEKVARVMLEHVDSS